MAPSTRWTFATEKPMERARARILVVEDDEGIARALRLGLAFEGYTVDVAPDGTAALEALSRASISPATGSSLRSTPSRAVSSVPG